MDRHFCDSYADAFPDSDRNPNAERDWNSRPDRLSLSYRQSNPVGDIYTFTDSYSDTYTYTYRFADTGVDHCQPLAKTS
jgi:hypothetical protein